MNTWISNLRELSNTKPIYNYINSVQEELEKKINESIQDSENYFTEEEAKILKDKIERLSKKVSEVEEEQEKIKEFQSTMQSIISDLQNYKKGFWYKVSSSKILKAFMKLSQNQQVQELVETGVQKLIE